MLASLSVIWRRTDIPNINLKNILMSSLRYIMTVASQKLSLSSVRERERERERESALILGLCTFHFVTAEWISREIS